MCVWCHALGGGGNDSGRGVGGQGEADERVEGYKLTKCVCAYVLRVVKA